MAVHSSGEHIIVAGPNRRVVWYDMDIGSEPYKILRHHESSITDVGFHNSYPLMFSASTDGVVEVIHAKVFQDLTTNPQIIPVKKIKAHDHSKPGGGHIFAHWHPTQPWLFTGGAGGRVYLWA